ncbi:MAG: bacterio-opsin activator domain-containing protein [Halobacteriales archaeon]
MARPEATKVDFELKELALDEAPIGISISDADQPDNPLIYVNDAFERLTGYAEEEVIGLNCRFLQGEQTDEARVTELREAIQAEDPVTVELINYRRDDTPFWNEVTVAPLRDEGGQVTNYVGFQVDVTDRKEAQLALSEERERLDRLVDRINGLLADVTELLMQGVDREETELAILDRIASTDSYAAAWIGEPDLSREVLYTSSASGFPSSVDDLSIDLDSQLAPARAYTEKVVVKGAVATEPAFDIEGAAGEVAAVPLIYGDATYGVLAVVGVEAEALDDRELVVLESVGRTIATAINAAQSRRGLTANDLIELEFSISDPAFFPIALAGQWDCRLELRGSTTTDDGQLRLFLDAGEELPDVPGPTDGIEGVVSVTRIGGEDAAHFELDLEPGSVFDRLAERGAEVRSLTAQPGQAELEVAVPEETGGRVILELLEDRFQGVELLSYRERERRPRSRAEFVAEFEDALTERQATALRSAYYSGYYDEPRTTSGDELAAAMQVSRPTFHQHLRAAERKLLAAVLD